MGNQHKKGDGQAVSDAVDKSAASCYDSFRLRMLFQDELDCQKRMLCYSAAACSEALTQHSYGASMQVCCTCLTAMRPSGFDLIILQFDISFLGKLGLASSPEESRAHG